MAKYKMAATEMVTGRIIPVECHRFLFHIAEFSVRPVFPHKIYAVYTSEVQAPGRKQLAGVRWEAEASSFIFSLP